MADNTILNPGVGGDTVRNEEIGGVKFPISKIYVGASGVDGGPVTAANPFPTSVQGTVACSISGSVPVTGTFFQATQPVSGPLTDAELRASPVSVSGTVSATCSGTVAISGSVAVTGPLTDTQLRAAAVPVSGTFFQATQPVSAAAAFGQDIYVCAVLDAAVTANIVILSLYNADATLKVDILRIVLFAEPAAVVTGIIRGFRAFRFTTLHSAGTVGAASKLNTAMGNLDADITIRNNGVTIGGAEAEPLAACSVAEEETGGASTQVEMFNWTQLGMPITLNTNEGIAIRRENVVSTATTSALIYFRVR